MLLWAIKLTRMSFRLFSVYERCDFLNWSDFFKQDLRMFFPVYHRIFSVCFPNVFSMVSECFQNRPNTSRMLTSKGFLSERSPYAFRMLSDHGESISNGPNSFLMFPHAFRTILKTIGKHSSRSRSIRGVRKAYGTQLIHTFHSECTRN